MSHDYDDVPVIGARAPMPTQKRYAWHPATGLHEWDRDCTDAPANVPCCKAVYMDPEVFEALKAARTAPEPPAVQIGTHPMIDVMLICDAYESGMGQGLKNKPMGEYRNPYDPVNDKHTYRAYSIGYDEGAKRSSAAPPVALAGLVAEMRAQGYHTWATAIERAAQPPSDDTARLDWLTEQQVDTIYLDDGRIIDVGGHRRPHDLRYWIDESRSVPTKGDSHG